MDTVGKVTFSPFDKLSSLTGLPKGEIRDIAKAVTENNKILNACKMHKFDTEIQKRKWRCSNCSGTVDATAKLWYEKGLKHSKDLKDSLGEL